MLSAQKTLPIEECLGRVLATATVACPPAVPIVVSGEEIDRAALDAFEYYGIKTCVVISDNKETETSKRSSENSTVRKS